MLLNIFSFSLIVAVISATGELTILNSPKSLLFTGKDSLDSGIVGDIILAALGHDVPATINWPGLIIKDPFTLAQTTVVIVHVRGVYSLPTSENFKTYDMTNSDTDKSYNNMIAQLNGTNNETVKDIKFLLHSEGVASFRKYFGDTLEPTQLSYQNLKPLEYMSHKHILDEIGYLNAASQSLDNLLKPSEVLIFRISFERLAKASDFAILHEAKNLISIVITKLLNETKSRSSSLLFVQTTDKRLMNTGHKHGANTDVNPFKDTIKQKDFPIIFNIVLWFSLAFVLALASISYVIATIDPGRDSLLYRVSKMGEMNNQKPHHQKKLSKVL